MEAKRAERRLAMERQLKDMDEVRALLDEAAGHLHDIDDAAHRCWDALYFRDRDKAAKAETEFWKRRWTASRTRSRLALRLGSHSPVTTSYETAIRTGQRLAQIVIDAEWVDTGDLPENVGPRLNKFTRDQKDFSDAIDRFLDHAKERVGVAEAPRQEAPAQDSD
jgi:hypothetical protein